MHLGLLIYGTLDTISGGFLYDRKLVEYLRLNGHHVELISLDWRSYPLHLTDNVSVSLYNHLKDFKGDLLLQDELNHPSLFWLNQKLKSVTEFPIFSIVHHLRCSEPHPVWQKKIYTLIEKRYLQTIDGFVFNSRTTMQTLSKLGIDLDSHPYIVAVPGGDQFNLETGADEIIERANLPGPLRIIFLGNLIPRKGLHILLEALARVPQRDLELTVIGNPDVDRAYTRRIQRQIISLGLSKSVRLVGALPTAQLASELSLHHLMAVPSFYEGYGIVYLEGMAFGLPAIATSSGAAAEIITEPLDGFLVPPGDPAALADRISSLAKDRSMLAEMGLAARNHFLSQPTWEQTTGSIINFLSGHSGGTLPTKDE